MNMVVLIGRLVRDPSYSEVRDRKRKVSYCIILSGGSEKF